MFAENRVSQCDTSHADTFTEFHDQDIADKLEYPDSITLLRELEVVDDKLKSTIAPTQQLNSDRMEKGAFVQISDVLKTFSGTFIKDYGGVGGLKTVSVRSLGANHTGVSYDGIGISDVNTGQIDLSRFSVDNLEFISLSQGQSDGSLQPARNFASAAIVQLQTKHPRFKKDELINGNFALKIGSFGYLNPSVFLNKKISDSWSASHQIDWLKSEGDYPYRLVYGTESNDSTSLEYRKNADFTQLRIESNWFGRFEDGSRMHIKGHFLTSNRGLPGATILYSSQDFASQRLEESNVFTQGNYRKEINRKWNLLINWKYSHSTMIYTDPDFLNSDGLMKQAYTQKEGYGSAALNYDLTTQWKLSLASDLFVNTMNTNAGIDPLRLSSLSYLSSNYASKFWKMNVGVLHSYVNEQLDANNSENFSRFTPYLGIDINPLNNLILRAFYKEIFRMPTFSDMYYPLMGNPDLLPEEAKLMNIGANYQFEFQKCKVLVAADIYANDVHNKIVAFPNKSIYSWTILNYGRTQIKGLDMNAKLSFELNAKSELSLIASHSYQRALDVTDPEGGSYLHQLPYTPRVSGSSGISWIYDDFYIQTQLVWSGHRYVLPQNFSRNRLEGYTDVQLTTGKKVKVANHQFAIKGEILNLLNSNYSVVRWFPMPGRNFRLSFTFDFEPSDR